jgi:flavin-dependent dehydrogenase
MERVDVVVVGARLAGCAVAAPLARAGRRVLMLDRMRFPSDQLSTHVLMPAGTSELAKLGALPRILALNPSRVRWIGVEAEGISCRERLRPASDGIDYGVCVPRDLQDVQLVESAREQGVDVRERCTVEALIRGAW